MQKIPDSSDSSVSEPYYIQEALDEQLFESSSDWIGMNRFYEEGFRESIANIIQRWWRKAIFKKKSDAAKTIQKYWRTVISNPNYKVCHKRLMYEYSGMM